MNKELIEIQRGCTSTAVIILDKYIQTLEYALTMDANIGDEYLFATPFGDPIFKKQLDNLSKKANIVYFVIRGISKTDEQLQNRYIGLVKDREFSGYNLPNNVIIVFTINEKDELKKISKELYHFCVVAF